MKPLATAALSVAGLITMALGAWPDIPTFTASVKDFSAFYTAGHLVGSPALYDMEPYRALENSLHGSADRFMIRMPWSALLWMPFSWLHYPVAAFAWTACMIGCLAAFIWLFPVRRAITLPILCWSTVALAGLRQGQDDALDLLCLGGAIALLRTRPFSAGLLLSICLLKPQLLILVPVVLIMRYENGNEERRILGGFLTGCGTLAVLSFAIYPDWMRRFRGALGSTSNLDDWQLMPNLHGTFHQMPVWELAASLAVTAIVLWTARRVDLDIAVAMAVTGGLLIGQHSYKQDLLLAYPLGLLLMDRNGSWLALACLLPVLMPGRMNPAPADWQMAMATGVLALLVCITARSATTARYHVQ